MRGSRGMTLVEILVSCSILSVVLLSFASGMFLVIRLMNAAEDQTNMRLKAEKYVLIAEDNRRNGITGGAVVVDDVIDVENFRDRAEVTMVDNYEVDVTLTSSWSEGNLSSKVIGARINVSVDYPQGFNQTEVDGELKELNMSYFIFEDLP